MWELCGAKNSQKYLGFMVVTMHMMVLTMVYGGFHYGLWMFMVVLTCFNHGLWWFCGDYMWSLWMLMVSICRL